MRFTFIRFWLRITCLLIPRKDRASWLRDWRAEIEQRIPPRPFSNILRDALFARRRNPASLPLRSLLTTIFLPEAVALIFATLLWFGYDASRPQPVCGVDLNRIAFVERSYATMGVALSTVTWRLERELTGAEPFAASASFRINRGFSASAQVSRDFFDLLGVRAAAGQTFHPDSPLDSVILSWNLWQERFRGSTDVLGKRAWFDDQLLRVAGVLPPDFVFASRRIHYYTPLIASPLPAGMVVKLKEGVSLDSAQQTLRRIAPQIEEGWKSDAYRLEPYIQVVRWRDTVVPGLAAAVICWIVSSLYLWWKVGGRPTYFAALAARLLLSILALSEVFAVFGFWLTANLVPVAIVLLWFYALSCTLAAIVTIRDHLQRCPDCLTKLRMPTSLGTWSSMMMDVPGTEYVCPRGHGWLHRDSRENGRSQWNRLDPTWRDLFVP